MRSSRVSTPSSSASPERFGAASLSSSLSSSSLLLDAGVLSTRSASLALLASLLLLSSLLLSLLLLLLDGSGGGGGGAFLSFLRFFASLEASLSLFLPIVDAAAASLSSCTAAEGEHSQSTLRQRMRTAGLKLVTPIKRGSSAITCRKTMPRLARRRAAAAS